MRSLLFAAVIAALAACAGRRPPPVDRGLEPEPTPSVEPGPTPVPLSFATPIATPAPLGSYRMTYYLVAIEAEHPGKKNTTIYGTDCKPLAKVSNGFARELALEGTGRLRDGRMLNWAGRCAKGRPKYVVLDETAPWGLGVGDHRLVPFRSIATDPNEIATGSRIYVAELDGIAMPGEAPWGGFVHDGCVTAVDVGEAIKGKHIDFFSGTRQAYHTLDGALRLRFVTLHPADGRCPAS